MVGPTVLIAALLAQLSRYSLSTRSDPSPCHRQRLWVETSVNDFRDGILDPSMYVSPRALLDPDSGCVEFFARFDVNNDGYIDLACADDSGPYLHLYWGSDSGYYPTNTRRYSVPGGGNVDIADLNLDGYAELIHSGWRSGHVTVYRGTPWGPSPTDTTWLIISGQSEAVAIYDLDRDSYLDILAGSDNGSIYVFWGSRNGYSTTNRSNLYLGGSVGHNIEVADFDRDGYGDIAASLWSRGSNPIVYWGPNRVPRNIAWLPVSPNNPHGITVADLNMDDWLDIVYTGYDTVTTAYIYYGSQSGFSVSNRELIHPGQCYGGSAAIAWNADKTLDLVFFRGNWGSLTTARPRVFFNRLDTTPHFSDARFTEIGELGFNASGGFVADLNYDGYHDLFVNNMLPDSQSYILWGPSFLTHTGLPSDRDHHGVWREPGSIYTRDFSARYLSSVYDLGQDSVIIGGTCSWVASEPPGSAVTIAVRAGNTPVPDSSWTGFCGVAINGGALPDRILGRRYLQYLAVFYYNRLCHLPHLERIGFTLISQPTVDVAVERILTPSGTIDSGRTIIPAVVVRNNRSGTPILLTTLRIGNNYTASLTDTLAPFVVDTLFFRSWTASVPGTHLVRCSVYAEMDDNPENDTLSTVVTVRVLSDATPLAVVSPPAAVESGSVHIPVVTVANRGTRIDTVPVHLWIGNYYHEIIIRTIPAASLDTITFPAWTASPAGILSVRCSTALRRDDSTYNDTLSRNISVYARIDAATIAILAPADTVDSGTTITPRAR
ncbi:MAG: VCBS repeat-containing protein, partial [candidate division WOR-3 bacterium]